MKAKTINNWKDNHQGFFQSLKRGKDDFDTKLVEKSLAKRATGYQYKEITKAVSGEAHPKTGKARMVKIKEVTKEVAPDTTAIIFWLKNRQPERWRDIVPSEETLQEAMDKYTRWMDDQIAKTVASVDQNVDQAGI